MNESEKIIYCDKCNYEFLLSAVNIKEADVAIGSETVTLVYFTCPKCKEVYRVLLKDKAYDELKEDFEKAKARIRKNVGSNNEEFARVLNSMVYKKQERLRNHARNTNRKYPGTFILTMSENDDEQTIKYLP